MQWKQGRMAEAPASECGQRAEHLMSPAQGEVEARQPRKVLERRCSLVGTADYLPPEVRPIPKHYARSHMT